MDAERVRSGLQQLVDHLRAEPARAISPAEAAAITEILLTAMHRYFSSIDGVIYQEFRVLSERIRQARQEIAELRPVELKEHRLPRAGKELEAIVQSTEEASSTIMDAAETIMAGDPDTPGYREMVQESCLRIFEACSFQDLTGQRISKVVDTLTFIEERLHRMNAGWAGDLKETAQGAGDLDRTLLSGPALPGEGMDQSEVDKLMDGGTPAAPAARRAARGAPAAAEKRPAPATKPAARTPGKPATEPAGDTISQDEIDALFA